MTTGSRMWSVWFRLPNGEEHEKIVYASERAEAVDLARNMVERARGKRLPRKTTVTTLAELFDAEA